MSIVLVLAISLSAHSNKFNLIFLTLPPPFSLSPSLSQLSSSFASYILRSLRKVGTLQHSPSLIKLQTNFLILPLIWQDCFSLANFKLGTNYQPIFHMKPYRPKSAASFLPLFQGHIFHIGNILFLLIHFLLLAACKSLKDLLS